MATISGMVGNSNTYFAGSPVVIDIGGLSWGSSPFTIVRVKVYYGGKVVGEFFADTGGQTSISFDIQSALRAMWMPDNFSSETRSAQTAAGGSSASSSRSYRSYSLEVLTEYLDSTDGELVITSSGIIAGGQCLMGRLTEMERMSIGSGVNADASYWQNSNVRYGDASTKPHGLDDPPERVGSTSITSWVDVSNSGTQCMYYPAPPDHNTPGITGDADSTSDQAHAPLVLRDSIPYTDFLFVNRRGAVETCSALSLEAMAIDVESKQYSHVERPSFSPSRSIMAVASDGRRSWPMSSGHQTREWAEWWALEFLAARQWWVLYKGVYVPAIVKSSKGSTSIYDRTKQQMPHVDFTVTLALEG